PHGLRLRGDPAAAHRRGHVVLALGLDDLEGLLDDHPQRLAREVVRELAAVDRDLALAGLQEDARDRVLALAGAVRTAVDRRLGHRVPTSPSLTPRAAAASAPRAGASGPRRP